MFGFRLKTKDVLRLTVHLRFDGRCPYSNEVILDPNGDQILDGSEFDHFNGPNNGGPQNAWLIAKPVHSAITRGELTRQELRPFFEVYQRRLATIWKPKVITLNQRSLQLKLI